MENGVITLTNTKQYPFNDSARTVALKNQRANADYLVLTEVLRADGEAGEVRVDDRAVNGFRIAFDGSAASAEIRYFVLGGGEA